MCLRRQESVGNLQTETDLKLSDRRENQNPADGPIGPVLVQSSSSGVGSSTVCFSNCNLINPPFITQNGIMFLFWFWTGFHGDGPSSGPTATLKLQQNPVGMGSPPRAASCWGQQRRGTAPPGGDSQNLGCV